MFVLVAFCWVMFRIFVKPEKYINRRGYVVLSKFNELEHRYVAKKLLKRELAFNEVVHHINGKKTDNQVENLCLMDREKHEHFHAWLLWKYKKSGQYPNIKDQKRILENDYNGILLAKTYIMNSDQNLELYKSSKQNKEELRQKSTESLYLKVDSPKIECEVEESYIRPNQKQLFEELRSLRKQIANEKNILVYKVFENRTLAEMSEKMPKSESEIMKIWGVGPVKFQMYGRQFLEVIRKHTKI